jgi:hypothetical protein
MFSEMSSEPEQATDEKHTRRHRRQKPVQRPAQRNVVRFDVSTALTGKDAAFCDRRRRVVLARTDVSEDNIAYIFRVKDSKSPRFAARMCLKTDGDYDSEYFAMKMEAMCSSETSVLARTSRRRHLPEDSNLQSDVVGL